MADYDFSRISILIADDNAFMRRRLQSALRGLGVGQVSVARGGVDAVKRLGPQTRDRPQTTGPRVFDIVIAEQKMANLDGLMLLRWMRSHRDSPNRFMPTILMSGAAGAEDVAQARDAGVNEFVAKPYSAATIARFVLAIIERPRPYIYCASYFGPDRRRIEAAHDRERRQTRESEIRVVYGDRPPAPLTEHGHAVWRFHLPNRLRDKSLTGDLGAPPSLDLKLLEEAEREIGRAGADYADWVKGAVARLNRLLASCERDVARASTQYRNMAKIALELASQGGMFGYPLVTDFGRLLYEYLVAPGRVDERHVELVRAHAHAISAVIRQKASGGGGKVGKALIAGLRRAKKRYEAAAG